MIHFFTSIISQRNSIESLSLSRVKVIHVVFKIITTTSIFYLFITSPLKAEAK